MLDVILILVVGFFVFVIIVISLNPAPTPKTPKELYLDSLTESEITQKLNFYKNCSEELKKWADLRDSDAISEEEYQDKKKQGQYVNNAIAGISFVMKLIHHNVYVYKSVVIPMELISMQEVYKRRSYSVYHIDSEILNKEYLDDKKMPISLIPIALHHINSPQDLLSDWNSLKKSNVITEEEYQKLKEEIFKIEGVNKEVDIREQIESWSLLRRVNAITEEEFQKFKVNLLSTK